MDTWNEREVLILRRAIDRALQGKRAAPSGARSRLVVGSLGAIRKRAQERAAAAMRTAEQLRAVVDGLERQARVDRAVVGRLDQIVERVRTQGLPPEVTRYAPQGWCELAG